MATGGTAIIPEETNHLRLVYLCYMIAPEAVRFYFDGIHKNLAQDLRHNEEILEDLYNSNWITEIQWNQLFPNGQPAQVSTDFDITLLIVLLWKMKSKIQTTQLDSGYINTIRKCRNDLAHSKNGQISNWNFNIKWNELKRAIIGLSNKRYKTRIEQAKSVFIDGRFEEILKNVLDLDKRNELTTQKLQTLITKTEAIIQEITELKKNLNDWEATYANHLHKQNEINEEVNQKFKGHDQEIEKMITIQKSPIQANIQATIDETLAKWIGQKNRFIKRHAVDNVMTYLEKNNSVTLTGSSGTGKTALMRFVACLMKSEGYIIVPTTQPDDIRNFSQKGVKMLFVFDDVCGNYSVNMYAFEMWEQKYHEIESFLKGSDSKIISACRLEISKDANFKRLSVLNVCICNLNSPELEMNYDEKMNIALVAFKENATKAVEAFCRYECFPLICSVYICNETYDFESFIRNPYQCFKKELERLLPGGVDGKLKFCCLALCVVYNNNLHVGDLTDKDKRKLKLLEDVLDICELNRSTSYKHLLRSAENLLGSYFIKVNGCFRTMHDKLFDYLSFYIGSQMIEVLIEHADSDFISERLVCESDTYNVCLRNDFDILVSNQYFDAYVKRLTSDLFDSKILHVMSNRNLKCPSFSKFFLRSLNNLTTEEKTTLINIEDRFGQSILFYCCQVGNLKFTRWILHIGADINKTNESDKNTCLHVAVEYGYREIVYELLMRDEIKFDSCNAIGKTPIILAMEKGYDKITKILLSKGANSNSEPCEPL